MNAPLDIAVVGGAGPQGRGLADRFAAAGHHAVLGSCNASHSSEKATEINQKLGFAGVHGADNTAGVATASAALLSCHGDGHAQPRGSLADQLAGKIVIGFLGREAVAVDLRRRRQSSRLRRFACLGPERCPGTRPPAVRAPCRSRSWLAG